MLHHITTGKQHPLVPSHPFLYPGGPVNSKHWFGLFRLNQTGFILFARNSPNLYHLEQWYMLRPTVRKAHVEYDPMRWVFTPPSPRESLKERLSTLFLCPQMRGWWLKDTQSKAVYPCLFFSHSMSHTEVMELLSVSQTDTQGVVMRTEPGLSWWILFSNVAIWKVRYWICSTSSEIKEFLCN